MPAWRSSLLTPQVQHATSTWVGFQTVPHLFILRADYSSDPHAVPVQLQTTGMLGAGLSEPASSWAQAGRRHAGRPAEAVPVHQAWGRRFAAMGGNPSKVAASVFCTATLNRFNTPPVPALGEPRLRSATGNGKRSRRRKAMSADNAHLFFVFAANSPALEIRRKSASKE